MRLSRQCGERLTRTGPPHKRRSAAESGLSLDGFQVPGADFPERYKPYLHDANTIVTSQHK